MVASSTAAAELTRSARDEADQPNSVRLCSSEPRQSCVGGMAPAAGGAVAAVESEDRVRHVSKAPELAMLIADVARTSCQCGFALPSSSVEPPAERVRLHLPGAEQGSLPSFVARTWLGSGTGMALRRAANAAVKIGRAHV